MSALLLTLCLLGSGIGDVTVKVTCPVDGTKFKAVIPAANTGLGGIDRDLCRHSGTKPRLQHLVWTCPGCLFTGIRDEFDYKKGSEKIARKHSPSDELKEKILAGIQPFEQLPEGFDQRKIRGEIKFDLLARIRRMRGAPRFEIGKAYLQAAWTIRQHGAVPLDVFDEFESLLKKYHINGQGRILGQVERMLKGKVEKKDRADLELEDTKKIEADLEKGKHKKVKELLARYLILYLHRRHGENTPALKWIARLESRKGENSVVDDAVAKMKESIGEERHFQRRALTEFVEALKSGKYTGNDRLRLEYMIAELQRRLEAWEDAVKSYDSILEKADEKDAHFVKMVREQRALAESAKAD